MLCALMNQEFMETTQHAWVWDHRLMVRFETGGCRDIEHRIDLWAVDGHTAVAIEIEEGRHKRYDDIDRHEFERYNDLFMCFGSWFVCLFFFFGCVLASPDGCTDALGKQGRSSEIPTSI